jgi:hypothetical protein
MPRLGITSRIEIRPAGRMSVFWLVQRLFGYKTLHRHFLFFEDVKLKRQVASSLWYPVIQWGRLENPVRSADSLQAALICTRDLLDLLLLRLLRLLLQQ